MTDGIAWTGTKSDGTLGDGLVPPPAWTGRPPHSAPAASATPPPRTLPGPRTSTRAAACRLACTASISDRASGAVVIDLPRRKPPPPRHIGALSGGFRSPEGRRCTSWDPGLVLPACGAFLGPPVAGFKRLMARRWVFVSCTAIVCVIYPFLLVFPEPSNGAASILRRDRSCRLSARRVAIGPKTDHSPRSENPLQRLQNSGRGERIRTSDPLLPKQVRYQAALHPEPPPLTRGPKGRQPGEGAQSTRQICHEPTVQTADLQRQPTPRVPPAPPVPGSTRRRTARWPRRRRDRSLLVRTPGSPPCRPRSPRSPHPRGSTRRCARRC